MALADPVPERSTVRLALLDDHVLLLDSLASWIEEHAPGFDLVIRASTWLELVHSDVFPPDLVIMDLQLRETVSMEARVRTCRAAGAKVIMLSASDTRAERERAQSVGASAYLNKSQPMSQLLAVARTVMGLEDPHSAEIDSQPRALEAAELTRPHLSSGELEALRLYANGNTLAEVAAIMDVSYETAKTFLRRVRVKYGRVGRPTSTRAELVLRAAEDDYLL